MLNANEIIPTAALDQQDLISSIQKQPADRYFIRHYMILVVQPLVTHSVGSLEVVYPQLLF